MREKKVAIIGAGITGLVTAFYLKKAGIAFGIFEKTNYACLANLFGRGEPTPMKDYYVRFCERLGVKLPLPTRRPNEMNNLIIGISGDVSQPKMGFMAGWNKNSGMERSYTFLFDLPCS